MFVYELFRKASLSCLGGMLFFSIAAPLAAQFTTASLAGTVLDSSGAAIPEAAVSVRNLETGFKQATASNSTGGFLFPRLPVGAYELKVEKEGFGAHVQSGIVLTVDRAGNISVALAV